MRCYKCHSENATNAKFCSNCGSTLEPTSSSKNNFSSSYSKDPKAKPTTPQQTPPPASPYQPPEAPLHSSSVAPNIPTYLVQSILVTLFCCMPFGIVAIVFAAQVDGKVARGDINGAMSSSNNAKTFCWVAFILGLLIVMLQFGFVFLGAASSPHGY